MVEDLYEKAWLPLRNHFTPVMKLVEKERVGAKVRKKYDKPATPCGRLLACAKVPGETKARLCAQRAALDPMPLAEDVEARLTKIFSVVERVEEGRREEMERAGDLSASAPVGAERSSATQPATRNEPNYGCHES